MYNIDEIMNMLDWNKSEEEQQKGIELARNIKSFNVFLQPLHPGASKNVWDNCAAILVEKPDEQLRPYIRALLHWLEDINWPGALVIFERLKNATDIDWLCYKITSCVKEAAACGNVAWLCNMSNLLENERIKEALPRDVVDILEQHYPGF